MHLVLVLFLLSHAAIPAANPKTPKPAKAGPGEVTELVVPKACVQRVDCKGEWHLKNKMWSCPSLTVAFSCYRPKVEHGNPWSERH